MYLGCRYKYCTDMAIVSKMKLLNIFYLSKTKATSLLPLQSITCGRDIAKLLIYESSPIPSFHYESVIGAGQSTNDGLCMLKAVYLLPWSYEFQELSARQTLVTCVFL